MKLALLLLGALATLFLAALALGDQSLPPGQVLAALLGREDAPPSVAAIVTGLRLPRAVLAMLAGAALAVAGTISQAVLRNPLAEPGLIGVNAGAALAAMVVIVQVGHPSETLLPWLTFGGALAMALLIQALAWRAGPSTLRLILIGVALSAMAGAGASFIAAFGEVAAVQRAMIWLAGSLQDSRWIKSRQLIAWALVPAVAIWLAARELDLIALGDAVARARGQRVGATQGGLILACAAISGAAVAGVGLIAFVGLAAPHMARALAGRSHRRLIPAAALVGALMTLGADLIARRALAPMQLPVGVVTALAGAPVFAVLLWRRRHD